MIAENTYVFILAGGIGTRFWPLSRKAKPKQFLDILGTGKSLLRSSYERYSAIVKPDHIFVITNSDYVELVQQHIPELSEQQIMAEPVGKNTAPCVAYAYCKLESIDEDAVMIVAPSDHLILDEDNFQKQVDKACDFARTNDALVTLGIKPYRPDTGYGYIQFVENETVDGVNKVVTFTEKPPLEMAKVFVESGEFLWNSGMFVWSLKSIRQALHTHLEEMFLLFNEGAGAYNTKIEFETMQRIYERLNPESIDNGVLEKADNVYVLPSDFGWSDLGTWKSLSDNTPSDGQNKTLNVDLRSVDSNNNLVVSSNKKLVVLKNVNDLFIIDTEDALLICTNDSEQEVKKLVSMVKKEFNDKYS